MARVESKTKDTSLCPPSEPLKPFVSITEDGFGFISDQDGNKEIVRRYTLTNQNNMTVQIITYGATITSIKYPDKKNVIDDVVLGYDTMEGYLTPNNPYFGAVVGRVANRIAKGHFKLNHEDYQLSTNRGEFHLHGGFKGFDKVIWKSDVQGTKLVLSYLSKDGEEGYPGEVLVFAIYQLSTDNELTLEMKATCSKPTPINLTNHSYFNLAGHASGSSGVYQHLVSINADKYTATDENSIPTGQLKTVGGTLWDLRIPRLIGDVIQFVPFGGYDQNLCIPKSCGESKTFVARVVHPQTGRTLEVYSNQPGVQFYTANYFPVQEISDGTDKPPVRDPAKDIVGKNGVHYHKHGAFCLETQNYPDAVNHKNFPNSIINPGGTYYHVVTYKFGLFEEVQLEPEDRELYQTEWGGEGDALHVVGQGQKSQDDLLDAKLEENGR